jgi:hypothetical protein
MSVLAACAPTQAPSPAAIAYSPQGPAMAYPQPRPATAYSPPRAAIEYPPLQVTVARLVPSGLPAKPANCSMPELKSLPGNGVKKIGTIRISGVAAHQDDVLMLVRRKACEMGADAIFITAEQEQTSGGIAMYQVSADAIVYANGSPP